MSFTQYGKLYVGIRYEGKLHFIEAEDTNHYILVKLWMEGKDKGRGYQYVAGRENWSYIYSVNYAEKDLAFRDMFKLVKEFDMYWVTNLNWIYGTSSEELGTFGELGERGENMTQQRYTGQWVKIGDDFELHLLMRTPGRWYVELVDNEGGMVKVMTFSNLQDARNGFDMVERFVSFALYVRNLI